MAILSLKETVGVEILKAALSVIMTAGMDVTDKVTGATRKVFTDSLNTMSRDTVVNPVLFYDSDISYETANDMRRYIENRMAYEIVSIVQGRIKSGSSAGIVNILKTLPISNFREKCVFSEDGDVSLLPTTEEVTSIEEGNVIGTGSYLKIDETIGTNCIGSLEELNARKSSIDSEIGSLYDSFKNKYNLTLDQFWDIVKSLRVEGGVYCKDTVGPVLMKTGETVNKCISVIIPLFNAEDSVINELVGADHAEAILDSVLEFYTTAFKNEFKNYDSNFADVMQLETGEILLEICGDYHAVTPVQTYGIPQTNVGSASSISDIPVPLMDSEEDETSIILGEAPVSSADVMVAGVNATAGELIGEAVRIAASRIDIRGYQKGDFGLYKEATNMAQRDGIGTIVDVVVPTMDSKGQIGNYKTTLTVKVTMIPTETSDIYDLFVTNAQNRFNKNYDEFQKGRKSFWANVVMDIDAIKAKAKDKADRKILSELDILKRNVLDAKKIKPYNFFALNKTSFGEIMQGKTDVTTTNALLTRLSSLGLFLYDGSSYKVDYYYRGDRNFQADELQNLVSDTDKYQKELKNLIKMNR